MGVLLKYTSMILMRFRKLLVGDLGGRYMYVTQIAKILGSTSIKCQSDTFTSDRYLIDIDQRAFAIWVVRGITRKCKLMARCNNELPTGRKGTHCINVARLSLPTEYMTT